MRTIKETYELYAKGLPHNAGTVQRRETRQAFYAGASALFALVMEQVESGTEATDNDLDFMDAIHREILAFMDELHQRIQ